MAPGDMSKISQIYNIQFAAMNHVPFTSALFFLEKNAKGLIY